MNRIEPHLRNGLYLGLSGCAITILLYIIDIKIMLELRPLLLLGLYIYWMRKAVTETVATVEEYTKISFRNAWLCFVLGITISMGFMHLLASFIDTSILDITKAISKQSQEMVGKMLNSSDEMIEQTMNSPAVTNPYSLRVFALLLPAYFIVPGALLAFIFSRSVKQRLFNENISAQDD